MTWPYLFTSLILFLRIVHAGDHPSILKSSAHLAANYDFVICGAGPAGLVVAARLTEDANTSVLVLEAGGTGDDSAASISALKLCSQPKSHIRLTVKQIFQATPITTR